MKFSPKQIIPAITIAASSFIASCGGGDSKVSNTQAAAAKENFDTVRVAVNDYIYGGYNGRVQGYKVDFLNKKNKVIRQGEFAPADGNGLVALEIGSMYSLVFKKDKYIESVKNVVRITNLGSIPVHNTDSTVNALNQKVDALQQGHKNDSIAQVKTQNMIQKLLKGQKKQNTLLEKIAADKTELKVNQR